mgnify:CR=1 FL=1
MRSDRARSIAAAALIVAAAAFHFLTLRPVRIWRDDSCLYILHARNIAQGTPYGDTGFLYDRSDAVYSPRTYPPGLPLLLAPIIRWAGINLEAMRLETLLFLPLALWMIFLLVRRDLPFRYAAALIAMMGFSPWISELLDSIWSELPFLFFVYLALYAARRADDAAASGGHSMPWTLLAGVAVCLACATRVLGVFLVPALWLGDFASHRRPTRSTLGVTLMCLLWMFLQTLLFGRDTSYFDMVAGWSPRIILSHWTYVREFDSFWGNGHANPAPRLLGLVFLGFAAWGYLARLGERRVTALEAFLPLYALILSIWPPAPIWRYLLPVMPLVLFYSFRGVERIGALGRRRTERTVFAVLVAAVSLSFAVRYPTLHAGSPVETLSGPTVTAFFAFMREKTRPDDVFVFIKPRALTLHTGRRAALCHELHSDSELWDLFRQIAATHVVLGLRDDPLLSGLVERHANRFEPVFSNADFRVYQIRAPAPPDA